MIVYKKTDEWYNELQRVATSGKTSETNDNEWHNEWKRVTKKWEWVSANDSEW